MTLDRLLGCTAPLVLSDPDGENPFFSGTCFRVKFAGGMYVITARHCVEKPGIDLTKIRVECAATEQTFFPLKAWHRMDTLPTGDGDRGDIAIFEADLERMTLEEIDAIPALDLVTVLPPAELKPGWRLLVEGFPSLLQEMDYDQRKWVRGSEKLEACYEGPAEFKGTSKLSFLDASKVAQLDGFSGAPVFAVEKIDSRTVRAGFAGMMIHAVNFIDASIIIHALKKVIANVA